jgi:Tol biopolymer transport system component
MTAFDRFDPFERRITDAIDEIAVARVPDYLDDILQLTARSSQRPRWSFPERWFRVDTVMAPPGFVRRVPVRTLMIVALLAILAAAALVLYVGSRNRVPLPFGPARNGLLVYSDNGDLYARDVLTGDPRLFIGGVGDQSSPAYSPDGQYISFVTSNNDGDHFMIASADGTSPRQIALIPPSGDAQAAWAPDSRRVALIYEVNSRPSLSIVPIDGSPATVLDFGDLRPHDVSWNPRASEVLLVRFDTPRGHSELYTVHADGSQRHSLGLEDVSAFGTAYTLSGSTWAPDGLTIAHNAILTRPGAAFGGIFRVHLVNVDGSHQRAVPEPPSEDIQEAWPQYSPDGAWILVPAGWP